MAINGHLAPQRVATENNLADVFTKALGVVAFKAVVGKIVSGPAICSRGGVKILPDVVPDDNE